MIRIGHLSTFYHTAVILMAEGRIEKETGRPVAWKLFGTGPAIVEAFGRGELDLAYIGLPPAIIGIAKGVQIRCIAGGHMEGTVLSGGLHYRGYPEYEELGDVLAQFRGLRIGVPGKGSIHDVILRHYLGLYGLGSQVEVLNFPWADAVTEAAAKGQVAAAAGTPALAVALQRYAGGKILYPPSKTWPNNPSYGIVADQGFLEKERDTVRNFLLSHEEAAACIRTRPSEASGIIADYVGFVDWQFVFDTIRISPRYCSQLTDEYISSTMGFVGALKSLGYIGKTLAAEDIFDLSLIRQVHPEQDHYGEGLSPDVV